MSQPPSDKSASKVDIVSMGCRLNGYEADKMAGLAEAAGLSEAIIINSCAVTNEAVRQTRQKIRHLKKSAPEKKIIVTGCAAQIDPKSFQAMPEVANVLGNDEKMRAVEWESLSQQGTSTVRDIMAATEVPPHSPTVLSTPSARTRAFIQIQNGCDHRCTFCIIPFGRGNSRSVPPAQVITEVQTLVREGTKEVVLTGVDITSYGPDLDDSPTLGNLVRRILQSVPDLKRLRLSSIDGAEIDAELTELIVTEERIAPHLHLSLQSGDNMILKRMKRRHTREQAIEFCERVRAKRPDIVFGADIIAGFPTETEEMFANSEKLIDDCDLSYLHVFPYSAREGTPAAKMPQVEKSMIKERAARLRKAGDDALNRLLTRLCGKTDTVLTEKASDSEAMQGLSKGRLANFAEVLFETPDGDTQSAGQFFSVKLDRQDGRRLYGRLWEGSDSE